MKEKILNFFRGMEKGFQKGASIAILAAILGALCVALFYIVLLIDLEWLKVGYSVIAGWILGRALFLPIGSWICRGIDSWLEELRDRYYWWRERQ